MASYQSDFKIAGKKPLNVVIIGGSLTGLLNGVMLKQLGHNVRILEQNVFSERANHAAGMGTGPQGFQFLNTHDRVKEKYSFSSPGFRFLDKNSNTKSFLKRPINFTSWDTLYYRLRANFDGYASKYCPNPPESIETDGDVNYELGKRAKNVTYQDGVVTVEYYDLIDGKYERCDADFVIVADGANSTIRKKLRPDLRYSYSGYVAWRGTVAEEDVSEETIELWGDKFNGFVGEGEYIVGYAIPGPNGNLEPGHRLYNWVWYSLLPNTTPAFKENMTDTDNITHRNTLPIGKMRPEIWARQVAHANNVFQPASSFLELINKTTQPFISTLGDISSPQASFFDGRLVLVGEALNLLRPHIGMSFNQSAVHTLALERVLRGEKGYGIKEWEREVLEWGERSKWTTIAFGRYFLCGWLGVTFWGALFRMLWVFFKQRLLGFWWKLLNKKIEYGSGWVWMASLWWENRG